MGCHLADVGREPSNTRGSYGRVVEVWDSTARILVAVLFVAVIIVGAAISLAAAMPAGPFTPSDMADVEMPSHNTCPGPPVCGGEESSEPREEESSPPPEEESSPPEEDSPPPDEDSPPPEEEPPPPEEESEADSPEPEETASGTEPSSEPSAEPSGVEPSESEPSEEETTDDTPPPAEEEVEGMDEEVPGQPLPDDPPPPPVASAFYGPSEVGAVRGLAAVLLVLACGALVTVAHRELES